MLNFLKQFHQNNINHTRLPPLQLRVPALRAGIETLSISKKGSIAGWRHGFFPAATGANVSEGFRFDWHGFLPLALIALCRNVHAFLQPPPTDCVAKIPGPRLLRVRRTLTATI